jgi:peptidyl-tRNA hydrolase, PTH2 family
VLAFGKYIEGKWVKLKISLTHLLLEMPVEINRSVKQVIVMRNDLNMRKGKMIAQGAHASIMFLAASCLLNTGVHDDAVPWLCQGMTKICVRVDSEAELLDIQKKATEAGLVVNPIVDAGLTEFAGPTFTCLAIGPNKADAIDAVTGHLKLL